MLTRVSSAVIAVSLTAVGGSGTSETSMVTSMLSVPPLPSLAVTVTS